MGKEERDGEEWTEEWQELEAEATRVKEGDNLDFAKRRASEIPTNPRISLPKPTIEKREIQMRSMTERMKDAFKEYKDTNCDDKGRIKNDNLTKQERLGLKEVKESGNVFNVTDKSKEFSADSVDNYKESMKKHIEQDKELDEKGVARKERELNGHTVMWTRFLKMSQHWGQEDKAKSAALSKNGSIPKLKGMRKTHKEVPDERKTEGPDQRPVCMAKRSPNGALSHIQSEILNALADNLDKDIKTECRNTEEMLAALEKVNVLENKNKVVAWSME